MGLSLVQRVRRVGPSEFSLINLPLIMPIVVPYVRQHCCTCSLAHQSPHNDGSNHRYTYHPTTMMGQTIAILITTQQ